MDSETTKNGATYVRFGPGESDEMPLAWAEKMLTDLKNANPAQFGKLLSHAIGIETRKRAR